MIRLATINLAVLAVLLLATELLLRLIRPIDEPGRQLSLQQSISGLKPLVRFKEIAPSIRARTARSLAKPDGTIRILCIGASTTQQMSQETEDTWCGRLEQLLQSPPWEIGKRVETLSSGRAGQRSLETSLHLQDLLARAKPDIVITLVGINDLFLNGGPGYRPRNVKTEKSSKKRWNCATFSQICRLIALAKSEVAARAAVGKGQAVEWHSAALPVRQKEYRELPYVASPLRDADPIDEFVASMQFMLGLLKKSGAEAIVLGQPVLWKPDPTPDEARALWLGVNSSAGRVRPSGAWLLAEMQRFNSAQAAVAGQYGFGYLDLDAHLPKTLSTYFDDCHFTDEGSAAVASFVQPLAKQAVEKLILKR